MSPMHQNPSHLPQQPFARRAASLPQLGFVLAILLLGALHVGAPAAEAQDRAGRYEVGFDIGAIDFDGVTDDDTDLAFRVRGGYFFTDRLELEGQLFGSANVLSGNLSTATVNVVYGLTDHPRVQPYVLGGLGLASFEEDAGIFTPRREDVDEDGFAIQAGLGSRFSFTESGRFGGRLEVVALHEDTLDEATHFVFTAGLLWTIGN